MTKIIASTTIIAKKNYHEPRSTIWYFSRTLMLLAWREWQRVFMEPSRLFGMLLQPLIFLIVFGVGFRSSFNYKDGGVEYAHFFFPGVLGLVVLFASIYATLTLVDDKKCGLFRTVLCSPGGLHAAILGKILGTALLGFSQSLLFLPLLCLWLESLSFSFLILSLGYLFLGALCFSTLGVLFAWISPSSSAFHALMSIILIPMWLLSGAMFPIESSMFFWMAYINPMSHMVNGLRSLFIASSYVHSLSILFLLIFLAAIYFLLAMAVKKFPLK